MTPNDWIYLIACVGHLALCLIVLFKGAKNSLVLPLGLLCLDLFVWNFASWAHSISGVSIWRYIDLTFSPMTPALWFHFIVAFVGKTRSMKYILVVCYSFFGLISIWSATAFFVPIIDKLRNSNTWSISFMAGLIVMLIVSIALLTQYLRQLINPKEKLRTRFVFMAGILSGVLGSFELWDQWFLTIPGLSTIGLLVSTSILAAGVLRLDLFGQTSSFSSAIYASALGVIGVTTYVAVFQWLGSNTTLLIMGIATVTLVMIFVTKDFIASVIETREQIQQFANYGRFSAQMAHDLRNPLAALKGALQFLSEEKTQGCLQGEQTEILDLSIEQVERIETIIEKYRKMSAIEPVCELTQINNIVKKVLSLSVFTSNENPIKVRQELDQDLPECLVDRELIASILENLIKNAFDAMSKGGIVTVRTETPLINNTPSGVLITVEDNGKGMDARELEKACDDFYTTKTTGSGLGLAFAKHVAHAHGGTLKLSSILGKGTVVQLYLPTSPSESHGDPV